MLLCEDFVKFAVFRNIVEAVVKLAPFCISTCSLCLVLSFLSGPLLNWKRQIERSLQFEYSIYPSLIMSNLLSQLRQISTLLAAQTWALTASFSLID